MIPTSEKRDPDWGEDIPTPGNRASVLGQNIPTSGNYPSDSGQEIPSPEYLLPILRQIIQNKKNFGQLFGLIPRFVQRSFVCPHKLEKIPRNFLESAENRHIFALSKETNDKDNNKV